MMEQLQSSSGEPPLVDVDTGEIVLRAERVNNIAPVPVLLYEFRSPKRIITFADYSNVLVAIGIIGTLFLAGMAPRFTRRTSCGRRDRSDLVNMRTALDAFEIDMGRYPTSAEGLDVLVNPPNDPTNWHGPYLKMVQTDSWGHPWVYQYPGTHQAEAFDLYSVGADGASGTADDITNW